MRRRRGCFFGVRFVSSPAGRRRCEGATTPAAYCIWGHCLGTIWQGVLLASPVTKQNTKKKTTDPTRSRNDNGTPIVESDPHDGCLVHAELGWTCGNKVRRDQEASGTAGVTLVESLFLGMTDLERLGTVFYPRHNPVFAMRRGDNVANALPKVAPGAGRGINGRRYHPLGSLRWFGIPA